MSDTLDTLVVHCVNTLPDSLAERKRLLRALNRLMGSSHPLFHEVERQIGLVESVERHQLELQLKSKR